MGVPNRLRFGEGSSPEGNEGDAFWVLSGV
jgi:hypothetical protein